MGSAGGIEGIAYEDVTSSADSIKSSADNVKNLLDEVRAKMRAVNSDDVWKSDAAGATYEKFEALAKNFEGLYNELTAYGNFLHGTVATYREADAVMKAKAEELLNTSA